MRPHGRDRLNNNAQSLTLRLIFHSQMLMSPDGEACDPTSLYEYGFTHCGEWLEQ
jgi:hypothetical protein